MLPTTDRFRINAALAIRYVVLPLASVAGWSYGLYYSLAIGIGSWSLSTSCSRPLALFTDGELSLDFGSLEKKKGQVPARRGHVGSGRLLCVGLAERAKSRPLIAHQRASLGIARGSHGHQRVSNGLHNASTFSLHRAD